MKSKSQKSNRGKTTTLTPSLSITDPNIDKTDWLTAQTDSTPGCINNSNVKVTY